MIEVAPSRDDASGPATIFVNRFFYPDHSATSLILTNLLSSLAATNVHVLTGRQSYSGGELVAPWYEKWCNCVVHRMGARRLSHASLVSRAISIAIFYGALVFKLFRVVRRGDRVVVMSDPPLLGVVVQPVVRIKGAKVVLWHHDVFPEIAEKLGIGLPGIVYKLLKSLRNRVLRRADYHVALSGRMSAFLIDHGASESAMQVVPNWPLVVAQALDSDVESQKAGWGLTGHFIIGYSGNLGRAHDWQTMLDVAFALRNHSNIHFLFSGGGAGLEMLKQKAFDLQLGNIVFKDYQPLEALPVSLAVSSVHLVSVDPRVADYLVPSKLYGIMAVSRPVLYVGPEDSEVADIIKDSGCGRFFENGDAKGLAAAILELSQAPDKVEAMGNSAKSYLDKHFSREQALRKWQELLESL